MIAANIGKIFLDAYNEKFGSNYTAKVFFVEKYFPVFFDHEKYMQWVINSPFVQGLKKGVAPTSVERKVKLEVLVNKISTSDADASIAIGFPSLDVLATTSGQITNLCLPLREEEMYQSWIGSSFGIGVQGGLCILFDNPQILLDLFDGWELYRDFLNTTSTLKGNQINNWNGQWLAHRYNIRTYDEFNPTASFNPIGTGKEGGLEVKSESWSKVLLGIAQNYPDTQMTSYVYSLVKVNITVGFIPFELPRIRKPYELYSRYFSSKKLEDVENLFGTAIGFQTACEMGVIGANALEPKGFKNYINNGVVPKYNENDEEKTINFNTYQIWLLAMLNNEQLWEKAQDIAATLSNYSKTDRDLRTKKSQEITNLLTSVNKKQFIESLIEIVKESPETDQLAEIAEIIHTMPIDNVPYFLTLIRFQYAVANKKS